MNENVIKIDYLNKEIYLIKTAHVSNNSIDDVNEAFKEINPDSICIELDQKRYDSLKDKDAWRNTDIIKIIKDKQVIYLLVNTILASFQRRMAKKMDTSSGGEMLQGIKLAQENNKHLILADREVKTTFSRIWNALGFNEKIKLISGIIESIFSDEDISEEEIGNLKQADVLEAALNEVGKEFPGVKKVLVDERDQYLAQKIKNAPGNKIMAIIGAAHSIGIQKHINDEIDINELEKVEKKKGLSTFIKWAIPILIIGMIIYTLITNFNAGLSQIKTWVLVNGTLSALGVLLARGHILSILTAFIISPITSLNPLLAAGFFAGIVEATIRKPKVKDFEDIGEDTQSFKGFFKNNVMRILLIVLFANVFSAIGTFVSGLSIFSTFINNLK